MVAHLEWNCSRLRKLMKLSPGPVSVHPSQVSCITLQSLELGCEAKERSAVGRRKSIAEIATRFHDSFAWRPNPSCCRLF